MSEVVIYTKDYCPYCTKAKQLLTIKKANFKEIDVTNSADLQQEMLSKSNGHKTVPQIHINGKFIGGCDDLYALNDKGELDKLLAS